VQLLFLLPWTGNTILYEMCPCVNYGSTGRSRCIAPPIFTSAQDGRSASGPSRFNAWESTPPPPNSTNSVGRPVCPRASHNVSQKRKLSYRCWEPSPLWAPVWIVLYTNKSGQDFVIIRRRKTEKLPRFHLSRADTEKVNAKAKQFNDLHPILQIRSEGPQDT
jgi:hypothetical protein